MFNRYDRNLEDGKRYEDQVENHFKKKGFKTKRYVCYDDKGNETYQTIVINGNRLCHPDMEISIERNTKTVNYLVEVKSFKGYQIDGYQISGKLKATKYYAPVPKYQFDDYVELQRKLKIPVRIVFILKDIDEWYWETLDYLDETKILISEPLYKDRAYYFWELDWLRNDF